jgi:hypothetical protein
VAKAKRGAEKQKRIPFLENEPEKLQKINNWRQKRTENEPKNEAEKLLKTRACGKNEPKNEPGHVVENIRSKESCSGVIFRQPDLRKGPGRPRNSSPCRKPWEYGPRNIHSTLARLL